MYLSATDLRPRVLHITQPVDGGVARVVTDLTRAQLAAGLRVVVACPDSALAAALRSLGADVRRWEATRAPGPSLGAEARRLARVVADVRPDLVHAHSAKAGLAGRLAVRGRIPTVFQPHAWSFEAVGGNTAALARAWERWGARWAARVVCVSEAERRTGVRAGVRARWAVIPNGVDPDRFRPAGPPGATAGPWAPLVVCVGRLCRQKGQDVLLTAWERVLGQVPGARLVLVGDGPDRERLRARTPRSVRFEGPVADPAPWYRAADLVVLPSRWEGMALAPLEAMACGRPVVVTDVAGAREALPAAAVPHCVVPAGDPAALAEAVTGLLTDPALRASLGRLGPPHVREARDVRLTTGAVTALYRQLLADGPGARRWPAAPAGAGTDTAPHRRQPGAAPDHRQLPGAAPDHRQQTAAPTTTPAAPNRQQPADRPGARRWSTEYRECLHP